MDEVARVEREVEERVAEVPAHHGVDVAARDADADRLVPLRRTGEVGGCELVDVIADAGGKVRRILDQEAGAAGEPAPDPEGAGEGIAALDPAVARAAEAEIGARACRQHRVAGEGEA